MSCLLCARLFVTCTEVSCGALRDGDFVVILAPGRILFFCNDFHSPHRDELND